MGYEINLAIGQKKSFSDNVFIEIVRIDLSKIGTGKLNDLIAYAKGKDVSEVDFDFLKGVKSKHLGIGEDIGDLFGLGGSYDNVEIWEGPEKVDKDLYGDPLPAIPLLHMLAAINIEVQHSDYRRFDLVKDILDSFNDPKWDNIYVVPYGH
jgi:hypothetical protein